MDGLVPQLPDVDGNLGDGVGPDAVGDADLELVAARRGVVLDDQEACALVQHEVAGRRGTDTHTHTHTHTHTQTTLS